MRVSFLALTILTFNFCIGQTFDPHRTIKGTPFGDTTTTFYPNQNDTSIYVKNYFSNGVLLSSISCDGKVQKVKEWITFPGDTIIHGIETHILKDGKEIQHVKYFTNSGIPEYTREYLSDSIIYICNNFSDGNPMSAGYAIVDSKGVHKKDKWIEFDSSDKGYWIGEYLPTYIECSDTIYTEWTMGVSKWAIMEFKHGKWTKFNSDGKVLETLIYKNGKIANSRK